MVTYEYGIFSTCVPGRMLPPGYLELSPMGTSEYPIYIIFKVPSPPSNPLVRGFNVCVVYKGFSKYDERPFIKIYNKTNDLSWMYSPNLLISPNKFERFIMLSHWKSGNVIECGDEVEVSIIHSSHAFVEKFACKILYDDADDPETEAENKSSPYLTTLSWKEKSTLVQMSDLHVTGKTYLFLSRDYSELIMHGNGNEPVEPDKDLVYVNWGGKNRNHGTTYSLRELKEHVKLFVFSGEEARGSEFQLSHIQQSLNICKVWQRFLFN